PPPPSTPFPYTTLFRSSYRFSLASSGRNGREPSHVRMLLAGTDEQPRALAQAIAVGRAVALARDLANTPSARKSPGWLAGEALRSEEHTSELQSPYDLV